MARRCSISRNEVKFTSKMWLLSFASFLLLIIWGLLTIHSAQVLPDIFIYSGIKKILRLENCKDPTSWKNSIV